MNMNETKKVSMTMKKLMVFTLFATIGIFASSEDLEQVNQKLLDADNTWTSKTPAAAAPLYDSILQNLPQDAAPFRATIIMRAARAKLAAGDKKGCLTTLDLLKKMDYVPEHHALAAAELRAEINGKPLLGHGRTPLPPVVKAGRTIFVDAKAAPGGDGSANRPFASLHDAIMFSRQIHRRLRSPKTIEIVLAPGTYNAKPAVLSDADSGMPNYPFIIRSRDPQNRAVISGGITLKKWNTLSDTNLLARLPEAAKGKALICDLQANGVPYMPTLEFGGFISLRAAGADYRFATMPVPEMFYKGEPQTMARWPNKGFTRIPINEKPKADAERFKRWADEDNLWLYGYWRFDWADAYEKIASVSTNGAITLKQPCNYYGFGRRTGCAVNALCELDVPGEWYIDKANKHIIFFPPADFNPEECILSVYGPVISADRITHLQVRDLDIEYVRGDAMLFKDCSDLLLANLKIRKSSGLGIRIDGGRRHMIHSCSISGMGRGGIDILAGDWKDLMPSHSIIENCSISRISRIDRTYTPALLLEGMGIHVRHCEFKDIPSSAIRLEACDSLIELNHFKHCVYESGDQGAIDMWSNPLYRGNIIRWNDFDRIINPHARLGAAAVRCDNYMSGFMIDRNIMRKSSPRGFGAVQFNEGTDNYVEGNIIVDWKKAFSGHSLSKTWEYRITTGLASRRVLEETPWQSEAWKKKYPMVRDLMNGSDNHNYLTGNLLLGSGDRGKVGRSINLANRSGDKTVHGETLQEIKPYIVPWYPIPIDEIGTY
jgi:hypothetical protein